MIRSIGAGALTAAVIVPATFGAGQQPWPYYFGPMHGGAWSIVSGLWMLVFWTLAAVGTYTVATWMLRGRPMQRPTTPTNYAPAAETSRDEKIVRSDT